MAKTKKIQIHGPGVSLQGKPYIYANVTTTHSGWSGTTPLYTVKYDLLAITGGQYFGFNLYIDMGRDKDDKQLLKGNSPSTWGDNASSVTFYNVPKGLSFILRSDNCGCNWWKPGDSPDYDDINASGPGVPGYQYVNNSTGIEVLERDAELNLTWSAPGGGTFGISGYKLYYSIGQGWQYFKTVNASTTSYKTSIADLHSGFSRGAFIGFQVTAYNDHFESAKSPGAFDNNSVKLASMTIGASNEDVTPVQAKINWSSNINVKIVKWKLSTETNWRTVTSGINTKSGSFNATGLKYNTKQTVQVQLTANSDGTTASASTSVTTLDIARITAGPDSWSIEDFAELSISNKAGCTISLYLSYNNVEVINRTNIELEDGKYKLVLDDYEKNMLYIQASSDRNPSFKFILKSYIAGVKVDEMSRTTLVTFPTKAWVKVSNVWKRALVWSRPNLNSPFRQSIPWVDPNRTKNWKKI